MSSRLTLEVTGTGNSTATNLEIRLFGIRSSDLAVMVTLELKAFAVFV